VHLDLGDGALEAEQQAPVRGTGVVNPVAIGDQAVVIAAQVKQRVPVLMSMNYGFFVLLCAPAGIE
jgi:hypothetical protein